jgi:hypothetical protein
LYARPCGTQQRLVSPIVIISTHSRQPAMTRFNANMLGMPRAWELSKSVPPLVHPV